jgi:hypothetical protein
VKQFRQRGQLSQTPRAWEQDYLAQFTEPDPSLGQRVWRLPVDATRTAVGEVLTFLVIVALKQGFPVAMDDQQTALTWVQQVMHDAVRRLGEEASGEEIGAVFHALVAHFDLPATPWALQDYIKETTRGIVRDARKASLQQSAAALLAPPESDEECGTEEEAEPESDAGRPRPQQRSVAFWSDPATGERRYADVWAAQTAQVSPCTVARWRHRHGVAVQGLSEAQLAAFQQEYEAKAQRQGLRDYQIRQLGKTPAAAKKWRQRHAKRGESVQTMAQALLSRQKPSTAEPEESEEL